MTDIPPDTSPSDDTSVYTSEKAYEVVESLLGILVKPVSKIIVDLSLKNHVVQNKPKTWYLLVYSVHVYKEDIKWEILIKNSLEELKTIVIGMNASIYRATDFVRSGFTFFYHFFKFESCDYSPSKDGDYYGNRIDINQVNRGKFAKIEYIPLYYNYTNLNIFHGVFENHDDLIDSDELFDIIYAPFPDALQIAFFDYILDYNLVKSTLFGLCLLNCTGEYNIPIDILLKIQDKLNQYTIQKMVDIFADSLDMFDMDTDDLRSALMPFLNKYKICEKEVENAFMKYFKKSKDTVKIVKIKEDSSSEFEEGNNDNADFFEEEEIPYSQ
jgi:hypothetical protein